MARVLVADPIDELGVARLKAAGHHVDVRKGLSEDELCAMVGDYEAMVVRSETKVTERIIEHATKMLGIGRAGVGVDNIDVDAATQHGIAVVNSPTGNTIAAAEHAFALMISLARNIPQADASMRRSEWTRSRFMGVELRGKTLGIIGLGRVGSEVAHRARAFQMHVIAYDPYVSMERVRSLGVESVPMERPAPRVRLHHHPHAAHLRHEEPHRRAGVRAAQARCPHRERGARGPRGRAPAAGRAGERKHRRGGAGRLPRRAAAGPAPARGAARGAHAPPRRVHGRGAGGGGAGGGRPAAVCPERRSGAVHHQHAIRSAGGHGGARPLPACRDGDGTPRHPARRRSVGDRRGPRSRGDSAPRHRDPRVGGARGACSAWRRTCGSTS